MTKDKITIFLSHSHKDQDKVRKIRDVLESLECEPLIFFLKCLDDKNSELEKFIKDEIQARNIFVYCKSKNAESSEWVQKEVEYLKSLDGKRFYTIDIENDFSLGLISFLQTIAQILKHNRAFISYSNHDKKTVNILIECLKNNGYQVQNTELLFKIDQGFVSQIEDAIDKVIAEGNYIFICSSASIKSKWCLKELEYAISKCATILPIIIKDDDDSDISSNLPYPLQHVLAYVIHREPTELELNRIVNHLNKFSM